MSTDPCLRKTSSRIRRLRLLNPMSNVGIDGCSSQERPHDCLFVGPDGGVRGFVGERGESHHGQTGAISPVRENHGSFAFCLMRVAPAS